MPVTAAKPAAQQPAVSSPVKDDPAVELIQRALKLSEEIIELKRAEAVARKVSPRAIMVYDDILNVIHTGRLATHQINHNLHKRQDLPAVCHLCREQRK